MRRYGRGVKRIKMERKNETLKGDKRRRREFSVERVKYGREKKG